MASRVYIFFGLCVNQNEDPEEQFNILLIKGKISFLHLNTITVRQCLENLLNVKNGSMFVKRGMIPDDSIKNKDD